MQLQEAINLVRQQFIAEAQPPNGEHADKLKEIRRAYNEAGGSHPAMMAVAHQIWAEELVAQNKLRAQQAQAAAAAGGAPAGAPAPAPGPAPVSGEGDTNV